MAVLGSAVSRVIFDAVQRAAERSSAEPRSERFALLVTSEVVWALCDHRGEIAVDELRRAWMWLTDARRWGLRGWLLAGVVARWLPRDVVLKAVVRVVDETEREGDDGHPLMGLPLREYLDRWEGRA